MTVLLRIYLKNKTSISEIHDFSDSTSLKKCVEYVSKYSYVDYVEIIPHTHEFKIFADVV